MSAIPHGTTLLPASAGTGKTFRIVDVLRDLVLDEGQPLDRIVVVTFTRAAAGELRERVRARFVQAREGLLARIEGSPWDPPDDSLGPWVDASVASGRAREKADRAWAALVAFDVCCIDTIHGFCQRVLAEAAFEAGAPFATELLTDANAVFDEVVDDFWLRLTHGASDEVLESIDAIEVDRQVLRDVAKKAADPDLLVCPEDPGTPDPVDLSIWRDRLAEVDAVLGRDGESARELLTTTDALHRRRNAKKEIHHAITPNRANTLLDNLPGWLEGAVPGGELHNAVIELSRDGLACATREGHAPPAHPLFDALQSLLDEFDRLGPAMFAWRVSLFHQVVRETRARLAEHLRRRNGLTFDALLRRVRDPLLDPDRRDRLRAAVRRRYDAAVVDEFQDTDPCQWDIFRELFADRLYLVGDPKQAIYRFRGADFATYLRAEAQCQVSGSLDRNQRTDGDLVKAVHHLFARPGMVDALFDPRIPYPQVDAARPDSRLIDDDRPPLQIRLLGREGRKLRNFRWLGSSDLEGRLPKIVANDVVRELNRGGRIRGSAGARVIGPADCAVLTRTNPQARAVARALQARGVPATVRSEASVMEGPEHSELVHVLRAISDPLQTRWLRRALLTDLLGGTAADVIALETDDARWLDVAERFRRWRALWDERGVLAVMRAVLDEGGVASRLLRRGDERALANVHHLAELLHRSASEHPRAASELVTWLEQGGPGLSDDDVALRVETDAEAVQCVTVHSAKGLQYPLVWAPWLLGGSWLTKLDLKHLVVQDADGQRRLDFGSDAYDDLVQRRKDEDFAEALRVIYVALTRAEHRVVLYDGACDWPAALGWLLHQRAWMKPTQEERLPQVGNRSWWDRDTPVEKNLAEDLDDLARHPHIAWDRVDWDDARVVEPWRPDPIVPEPLRVASPARPSPPDRSWGRTSYSGLVRRASPHQPAPELDHDEDEPEVESAPVAVPDPIPLADIPGSTRIGHVVHGALEHHDFRAGPAALGQRLSSSLALYNLPAAWATPLTDALADALRAPLLPDGFALDQLDPAHRWNELDFHLPLRGGFDPVRERLTPGRLRAAFEGPLGPGLDPGWSATLDRLAFPPICGFLKGSIDLVFRHDGRWYVADYKTNRLGTRWADYTPHAVRHQMLTSKAIYPLQYHLYAVALIRLLTRRIPGFDVTRDFGGVLYLFVRGMSPSRPGSGVFFDKPPAELLDRLDRALGGQP